MSEAAADAGLLAERVRTAHNGIMVVELHYCHDGHNVCVLKDYDTEVGSGESGKSMFNAIEKALSDFRLRKYLGDDTWAKSTVSEAVEAAIKAFGYEGDGRVAIFNTAAFQQHIGHAGQLQTKDAVTLLESLSSVVRLSGGSHWLRLPDGYTRHAEDESNDEP